MVFVWGWGGGRRRRRGWGGRGQGYGYGPPPGYGGYRRGYGGGGGGGGCLRDLLLLDAGCCLAESLGCGANLLLVAPSTVRRVRAETPNARTADRLIAAVRLYQREISPHRAPCCHFTPSCSAYSIEALETHGALRGSWLTARRLQRCRPGGPRGADPVPD